MKTLLTLTVAAVVLALANPVHGWVAYRGRCGNYYAGYHCAGVCTGTRTTVAAPTYVAPSYYYGTYYAGGTTTSTPPPPPPAIADPQPGTIVYSLPPGAQSLAVHGLQYYVVGNTYYQAFFGNNGVYYEVVAGTPP